MVTSWSARLLTTLGAGIDTVALGAARLVLDNTVMPGPESTDRLRASAAFYRQPHLADEPRRFFPFLDEPQPEPSVTLVSRGRPDPSRDRATLRFRSSYEPLNPAHQALHDARVENRTVRAELWRHRDVPPRATVVALHGFGMGRPSLDAAALMAPALFAAGLDVVLFTLPLHGRRAPRDTRFSGQLFANPEITEINEAMGQAVHDLSLLLGWLRRRDTAPVGLLGLSLGGYVTALMAALTDEIDFAIPMIAPACFGDLAHGFMASSTKFRGRDDTRLGREEFRAAFRVHSPLAHGPRLPRERMLLIAGRGDRVVPARHTIWLREHWRRPRLVWFTGSHLAPFGRRTALAAILAFLGERGIL
jgi:pimeloyl-ACP methyl ester carboxylesterase